jgi:hypothetical protein
VIEGYPTEPFVFPTDRRRVDCTLETGPAGRFTHTRNRVAVTAMAGDIGGLTEDPRDPDLGTGFGMQFPNRPGQTPVHGDRTISQLFMGGLMIGVSPDVVLTGANGGYFECRFDLDNGCRDLGLDATSAVNRLANGGRVVTWRYSDAPSGEGVGLRVTQRSFDAPQGKDYVLFRFTIRNGSNRRLNINPGIFTDFDIDDLFFDEVGRSQRGGRLLSQSNVEGSTTRVGTLMIGDTDPTTGYFFTGFEFPAIPDQIAILRGNRSASGREPGDYRYIQSVRAVGLNPGAETDLWVAVIAGEDDAAFAETADAAAEDIAARRRSLASGLVAEAAPVEALEWSYTAPAGLRAGLKAVCGKDCTLERLRYQMETRGVRGLQ